MNEEKRKYLQTIEVICGTLWFLITGIFFYGMITNTHPFHYFFLFGGSELVWLILWVILGTLAMVANKEKIKYY